VLNIPDEPSTRWLKSTFSLGNAECVELAALPDGSIGLRDSKDPGGGVLKFDRREIDAFLNGVIAGEFDIFR
jgi:hypothetical protein